MIDEPRSGPELKIRDLDKPPEKNLPFTLFQVFDGRYREKHTLQPLLRGFLADF
jgi:hypothetical protein